MNKKIGTKFKRKYGKALKDLSKELNVSIPSLCNWEKKGFDIYEKANRINFARKKMNRYLTHLWANMQHRCGNPSDKKYKNYGGKGIKIKMDRYDLVYLWERDKAYLLKKPSIDRIDPNGHYEISNCRFIEMSENRRGISNIDRKDIKSSIIVFRASDEEKKEIMDTAQRAGFGNNVSKFLNHLINKFLDHARKQKIILILFFLLLTSAAFCCDEQEVAKVISAEACGEGEHGMMLVSNVIANRSRQWNKTPYQVISQPNQFYGFTAKNKSKLYSQCKATSDRLAKDIMSLKDITNGALFFRQPGEKRQAWHKVETFRYKNHIFYK